MCVCVFRGMGGDVLAKEAVGSEGRTQRHGATQFQAWFVYFYPLGGGTVQRELFSGSLICCVVFCLQGMCKLCLKLVNWNCMC